MREAAERAYLSSREAEMSTRMQIVGFFSDSSARHSLERVAGELPWQLSKVKTPIP